MRGSSEETRQLHPASVLALALSLGESLFPLPPAPIEEEPPAPLTPAARRQRSPSRRHRFPVLRPRRPHPKRAFLRLLSFPRTRCCHPRPRRPPHPSSTRARARARIRIPRPDLQRPHTRRPIRRVHDAVDRVVGHLVRTIGELLRIERVQVAPSVSGEMEKGSLPPKDFPV